MSALDFTSIIRFIESIPVYVQAWYLSLLNWLLDGPPRRWLEGQRQKLDPWGGWMYSTFLDHHAFNPNEWHGRTEGNESRIKLDSWKKGANLLTSVVKEGIDVDDPETWTSDRATETQHILALDIDFPARWVPSSTRGKGHLYIKTPLPWRHVTKVLDTLADVGILHRNYVKHTKARGYTCLRPAFISKPKGLPRHFGSDFDPLDPNDVGI